MAKQVTLSDENCSGQALAIFAELKRLGYIELLELELITWEMSGLRKGTKDEVIWHHCQDQGYLLLTGNRTGSDGNKSLEFVIRRLVAPSSLPVLTISDLKRVTRNRQYCIECAQRLADIVFELEIYYGVTRLFLT